MAQFRPRQAPGWPTRARKPSARWDSGFPSGRPPTPDRATRTHRSCRSRQTTGPRPARPGPALPAGDAARAHADARGTEPLRQGTGARSLEPTAATVLLFRWLWRERSNSASRMRVGRRPRASSSSIELMSKQSVSLILMRNTDEGLKRTHPAVPGGSEDRFRRTCSLVEDVGGSGEGPPGGLGLLPARRSVRTPAYDRGMLSSRTMRPSNRWMIRSACRA